MGNRTSKTPEIIMLGHHSVGKGSLQHLIRTGTVTSPDKAAERVDLNTVGIRDTPIVSVEVGGRSMIRPLYLHFCKNAKGFIYVIDSAARDRLEEGLDGLLSKVLMEEATFGTVVMVMANKQDLPGAMTATEVEEALKREFTFSPTSAGKHTVFVRSCSAKTGEGISEALVDFAEQMRLKQAGEATSGLLSLDGGSKVETESGAGTKKHKKASAMAEVKRFLKGPVSCVKALFR